MSAKKKVKGSEVRLAILSQLEAIERQLLRIAEALERAYPGSKEEEEAG